MVSPTIPVAIVGVSGFAGAELAKLIDRHPLLELVGAVADRWAGAELGKQIALEGSAGRVRVEPQREALSACAAASYVLLATPNETSAELAPTLVGRGQRVIDLSGAFRLPDPEEFRRAYRFVHPAPELARSARYGLPELPATAGSEAPSYADARLVANPGCYATAAIASLAPLFAADLVLGSEAYCVGMSGVTGAGRKVEERLLYTELAENVAPYRVADHQHVPEIELALSRVAGRPIRVRFVPHLLPVKRGLLVTSYATLRSGVSPETALAAATASYDGASGLVRVVAPHEVTLANVAHGDLALVGWSFDPERGVATALGALDNLLKGAASQALQNLCALAGVPYRPLPSLARAAQGAVSP